MTFLTTRKNQNYLDFLEDVLLLEEEAEAFLAVLVLDFLAVLVELDLQEVLLQLLESCSKAIDQKYSS